MPEPPRGSIAIGFLSPGQVSTYFLTSILTTIYYDFAQEQNRVRPRVIRNWYPEWSSANVSQSRNNVAARFLERGEAEWLLMVDSDMKWEPEDLFRLLDHAHWRARPIVSGLCFGMANNVPVPTIYQWAEIPGKDHPTTIRVRDYPRDSLIKCAATGAAFLLIHRSVLVAMRDAHLSDGDAFPWWQETSWQGDPVGEDITFCLRAGSLGFPVFVASDVKIEHHKSWLLTEEMADAALAAEQVEAD